jgi:hypothetical protein
MIHSSGASTQFIGSFFTYNFSCKKKDPSVVHSIYFRTYFYFPKPVGLLR